MAEQNHNEQPEKKSEGRVLYGLGLTLVLHLIFAAIMMWMMDNNRSDYTPVFWLYLIGVSQLVYMAPALLITSLLSKPHLVKGLLIGAAITFLLNAACTGLMMISSWMNKF